MHLQAHTPIRSAACLPPSASASSAVQQPFADSHYLLHVIGHLHHARMEKGLSLTEVARKAGVRRSLIDRAEQDCLIPSCRDLKAWTAALGLTWEQIWSDCFPCR